MHPYDSLSTWDVLVKSSNIGMTMIGERMGAAKIHRALMGFGFGRMTGIDLPIVQNAINTQELRVLATTEPLLFLPWAVKRAMPAKLRESIQSILTELDETPVGRNVLKAAKTTGIEKAEDKDYAAHRRMTDAVFGPKGILK